jgi:hypothetical protein
MAVLLDCVSCDIILLMFSSCALAQQDGTPASFLLRADCICSFPVSLVHVGAVVHGNLSRFGPL